MPLANAQRYLEMLDAARREGYAFPAVNVTSSQTLNAALRGFAEARSDGIVQMTTGAAQYFSGPADDALAGAKAFGELAHVLASQAPVLIALHTDHCTAEHLSDFLLPLLDDAAGRRERGRLPLFNSHMFDGSDLPLDENLRISESLLRRTNELDLVLEVEIGAVGGEEDGLDRRDVPSRRLYSTPADAIAVRRRLGAGARGRYLLAASFGNVHGHYAPGNVRLRPALLRELQEAAGTFDFVFHGGSGSTSAEIRAAIANGVVKLNVDTDLQYSFSSTVARHFADAPPGASRDSVEKRVFDPRIWGRKAEQAMAAHVRDACALTGSAGRSLAGSAAWVPTGALAPMRLPK